MAIETLEVGSKFKVEDVYLDGVYTCEVHTIIKVNKNINHVLTRNETVGKDVDWLYQTDGVGERCLIISLNRKNETGWVYTLLGPIKTDQS